MGLLDRLTGNKRRNKRSFKEIRYDKILTAQQNQVLESALASNEALKMEVKSLRQVLFSQDDLYRELGIEPIQPNNTQTQTLSNGEFNTADLLASVAKGMNPDKIPGGRIALDALSQFLTSNAQEVNALGSHYIKQAIPKQEVNKQVVNQ
jgi:hypothetical protein